MHPAAVRLRMTFFASLRAAPPGALHVCVCVPTHSARTPSAAHTATTHMGRRRSAARGSTLTPWLSYHRAGARHRSIATSSQARFSFHTIKRRGNLHAIVCVVLCTRSRNKLPLSLLISAKFSLNRRSLHAYETFDTERAHVNMRSSLNFIFISKLLDKQLSSRYT